MQRGSAFDRTRGLRISRLPLPERVRRSQERYLSKYLDWQGQPSRQHQFHCVLPQFPTHRRTWRQHADFEHYPYSADLLGKPEEQNSLLLKQWTPRQRVQTSTAKTQTSAREFCRFFRVWAHRRAGPGGPMLTGGKTKYNNNTIALKPTAWETRICFFFRSSHVLIPFVLRIHRRSF